MTFIASHNGPAAMIIATVALFAAAVANILLVSVVADRFGHEGQDVGIVGAVPAGR